MSWDKIKFGALYAVPSRNGLTKPGKVRGSGYKMVNMGELFANGRIYDIPMERVPLTDKEKKNSRLRTQDLLFARQSLVLKGAGKCSIVMETSPMTVFESHLIRVRLNKKIASPLFYYYYFASPQSPVKTIVSQCAQAGIRGSDLGELKVAFPPLHIQRRIAGILSAYDDLIEVTQKQIALLELAADRLYREWFVDLHFPGHEHVCVADGLPEGWEKNRADAFFEITIGKTPPRAEPRWFTGGRDGVPWASISDMGSAAAFLFETEEGLTNEAVSTHHVKVVPPGTILVSFKLTVGRVAIAAAAMCTNEAIAHFRIADEDIREYTYCYLRNFHYETLGSTSSISKAVNSKIIKAMPFIMPDRSVVERFSQQSRPIFRQIELKQRMILDLRTARDQILARLMSEGLDVKQR